MKGYWKTETIDNGSCNRQDFELPYALKQWGWKYHHLGIPTSNKRDDEKYIPHLKFYVSGFEKSPFGIEWMRFEEDSPMDELIQKIPHLAFEVDNLELELSKRDFNVLSKPNSPSDGVKVAMIEHNGAVVELMEFESSNK